MRADTEHNGFTKTVRIQRPYLLDGHAHQCLIPFAISNAQNIVQRRLDQVPHNHHRLRCIESNNSRTMQIDSRNKMQLIKIYNFDIKNETLSSFFF